MLKEGRFGPYVTDGAVNVSLPRAETVEEITLDRAADLLAAKRAKGSESGRSAAAPRSGTTRAAAGTPKRATKAAKAIKKSRATTSTGKARRAPMA